MRKFPPYSLHIFTMDFEGGPTTMKLPRHVRVNFWCFFYHVLYIMIPLPQVLYLSGFGEI